MAHIQKAIKTATMYKGVLKVTKLIKPIIVLHVVLHNVCFTFIDIK